ncbi:hypothetical protein ACIBG8_48750 [Nonomuraea sp. NPDC050556]|uniref:hypothetical protein n=1 Tax=Nonomuraea sp. NPDC050556 TaxID=3364369 RepID=UPI0037A4CBF4
MKHRPLALCAAAMALLALFSGIGLLVDPRMVMDEGVWLKPFKFAASFTLYTLTLAWMIGQSQKWRRTLWWLGTVTVALFVVPEISVITFQAARGVRSHFNVGTAFDDTMFKVMGGAAYLGWVLTFALGVFLVLQRRVDRPMAWAVPLGLVISLAGMSVGYLMTAPRPGQTKALGVLGAHSVGGLDGGAGMPLTGWSTGAGDLRVSHFVGLHALQALPLLAIGLRLLARRFPVLESAATRSALVVVAALGYAGLTGLLVWQAQRGESLAHPGAQTLAAFAALVAVVTIATTAIVIIPVRHAARRPALTA